MNYELAKKLKGAGFPAKNAAGFGTIETPNGSLGSVTSQNVLNLLRLAYENKEDMESYQYVPTLSELIEACGKQFIGLEKSIDRWIASSEEDGNMPVGISGSTPEEAVANLWLAIKK